MDKVEGINSAVDKGVGGLAEIRLSPGLWSTVVREASPIYMYMKHKYTSDIQALLFH